MQIDGNLCSSSRTLLKGTIKCLDNVYYISLEKMMSGENTN